MGAGALVALAVPMLSLRAAPAPADIGAFEGRASVERGAYLDKAGNCQTCHTVEGGRPYAGGVAFETPFGTLYSTNITPDEVTGIGNWSFQHFHDSIKHGRRPDGAHLYPAFPYTDFARMSDEDIASLYLYFRTIEPVSAPAKSNELRFPYSQRALLGLWKSAYHDASAQMPDPAQSADWNRGRYLVEGVGHCGACHTPRNALGAERDEWALTGGVHLDAVEFGYLRRWSAVNLTPHASGLAAWSQDDLVAYLKTGVSSRTIVHGPMRHVVMNSTRHLSDGDLAAIATYLKSLPAKAQESGPTADENVRAEGKVVYDVHCGSCHLGDGKGRDGGGVPLVGSPVVMAADPSSLINVILYGSQLPPRPFETGRSKMKMLGKRLSDEKIANVASYVRAEFGNRAGAVSAEQVAVQR